MKNISFSEALRLISPQPLALLVSKGERYNIMAVSWWTILSRNPPMVGVSLSQKSHTAAILENTTHFSLCLPQDEIAAAAWRCGTTSGKGTDKFEKFGIELLPEETDGIPGIRGSGVVCSCRITGRHPMGDHMFFAAKIMGILGTDHPRLLFSLEGGRLLGTSSVSKMDVKGGNRHAMIGKG